MLTQLALEYITVKHTSYADLQAAIKELKQHARKHRQRIHCNFMHCNDNNYTAKFTVTHRNAAKFKAA